MGINEMKINIVVHIFVSRNNKKKTGKINKMDIIQYGVSLEKRKCGL